MTRNAIALQWLLCSFKCIKRHHETTNCYITNKKKKQNLSFYRRYLNWRISVENGRPVANFFLFCSPEDGLSLCYAWYTNYCIRVGKKCSFKKPKFLHLYIHSNNSAKIQPIEPKFGILVLRVIRFFWKKIVEFGNRVAEIWLCKDNPWFSLRRRYAHGPYEDITAWVPHWELVLNQNLTVSGWA